MADDETTDAAAEPQARIEVEDDAEKRRRRLLRAQVFGDVLPDSTSDDRDDVGTASDEAMRREWLKRQVPPHHGE